MEAFGSAAWVSGSALEKEMNVRVQLSIAEKYKAGSSVCPLLVQIWFTQFR